MTTMDHYILKGHEAVPVSSTLRRTFDAAWAAEDEWRDLAQRMTILLQAPPDERAFLGDLRLMRDRAQWTAQRALENYWEVRCLLRLVNEAGLASASVDTDVDLAYELYLLYLLDPLGAQA